MKKIQRWRYYCDFCKKAGQSGGHMKNHESACTLNPGRVCKMCKKMGHVGQPEMPTLLATLPTPPKPATEMNRDDETALRVLVEAAMPELRVLTNNCPACILAALRQKKIPVPIVESFNFRKEVDAIFQDIAEEEDERY